MIVSLNYEKMVEASLLQVVREALQITQAQGALPGDHYFYITFATGRRGVQMPERVRRQYPDQMTIVLQHMFANLAVEADSFSVELIIDELNTTLVVPFGALLAFHDPHVNFVMYFNHLDDDTQPAPAESGADAGKVIPIAALRRGSGSDGGDSKS
ncbi:hypothetical protein FACS1894186_2310 [Alphaproteobacteria bacterium]|nr:hypothetical protein FACS1894186_2310 [Alphaproteobacteria bacterium]